MCGAALLFASLRERATWIFEKSRIPPAGAVLPVQPQPKQRDDIQHLPYLHVLGTPSLNSCAQIRGRGHPTFGHIAKIKKRHWWEVITLSRRAVGRQGNQRIDNTL